MVAQLEKSRHEAFGVVSECRVGAVKYAWSAHGKGGKSGGNQLQPGCQQADACSKNWSAQGREQGRA